MNKWTYFGVMMALIFAIFGAIVLADALWKRLPARVRDPLGGLLIVVFIAYVVIAFAYAVLNPTPMPEFYEYVPHEWVR